MRGGEEIAADRHISPRDCHATASSGDWRGRCGSSIRVNQGCFCRRCTPRLGMQGSRCRSGIGIQASRVLPAGTTACCSNCKPICTKLRPPLPVGIDAAEFAAQAHGGTLQIARQHSDRHNQQQPIDACRIGCCSPAGRPLARPPAAETTGCSTQG